jgi:hypothetical protein
VLPGPEREAAPHQRPFCLCQFSRRTGTRRSSQQQRCSYAGRIRSF